jgi:DNA ligase-1
MIKSLRILKQLEELTGEGSQKLKQDLIKNNWDSELAYVFDVCFNPFVTTKLHKLYFSDTPDSSFGVENFRDLVEKLKSAPAANNSLRLSANDMVNTRITDDNDDSDLRKVLMKVLTKRMNVGIGAKLINKALGTEAIPDPSVMLATDDQSALEKWDKIYCEEKYDGVRVIAIYKDGEFSYFTRAFNELDSEKLHKITFSLKKIMNSSGLKGSWFFDGELTDLDRKSVSGKVTQILKGTAPDNIGDNIIFNVFDLDEYSTIEKGIGVLPYTIRRDTLSGIMSSATQDEPVKLATMWELDDPSQIASVYKKIVDAGGEGVICKNDHIYECKRSKSWIKFKEVNECDLKITGWYPGEGKREGFIGGLICTDDSGTLNVKIGSGFTDSDLQELSSNPDSLVGRICAVQYNVIITDKHGGRSLFLPRFVEVRNDKTESDNLSALFEKQ